MPRLNDYPIFDFSGGIRNDLSDFQKKDNEFTLIHNYDIDNVGRLKKRGGGHQVGDTLANDITGSFYWESGVLGSSPVVRHVVAESDGDLSYLIGSRLTSAVTSSSTTVSVDDATDFASSGDAEIEGDVFSYAGKTGNNLTTVTGLSENHATNAAVHQFTSIGATATTASGIYFASLDDGTNRVMIINVSAESYTYDGTTLTAMTDTDQAGGIFATVYRQRLYVAGNGTAAGSSSRNTQRDRVSFTVAGDADNWGDNTVNFFDVLDNRGESITGLNANINDELTIFKTNSFFTYNEVTLKQQSDTVGAFNHYVVQEIGGLIYTFCPAGVYVSDGRSVKRISDPVKDYIKDFRPQTSASVNNRTVTNVFATRFEEKYLLYIGDVSSVDSINDVLLVYDTVKENWTMYFGLTNIVHLFGTNNFLFGGQRQKLPALFVGDTSNKYYRMFSKKYIDTDNNSRGTTDGDIIQDLIADASGTPVSSYAETKFYDIDTPGWIKNFGKLRAIAETPGFEIFFRVENEKHILSNWIPVGEVKKRNESFQLPSTAEGYRIKFRIADIATNHLTLLTGLIIEDIFAKEKK